MRYLIIFLITIAFFLPINSHAQDSPQIITPENVDQLQLVRTYGWGRILETEWSPNGTFFAVLTPGGVWLYLENDLSIEPVFAIETQASSIEFNPSSGELWTSHRNGTLTRWHVPDGVELEHYQAAENRIDELRFSPDGSRMAYIVTEPRVDFESIREAIILQDTVNLTTLATIDTEAGYQVRDIVFSEKYLITNIRAFSDGFWDSIIEVRAIATGQLLPFENVPSGDNIAVSPDGQTLFTFGETLMNGFRSFQYDILTQSEPEPLQWVDEDFEPGGPFLLAPDGQSIYIQDGSDLYQYNIDTHQTAFIQSFTHSIGSIQFTPDGIPMIIGRDGSILVIDGDKTTVIPTDFNAVVAEIEIVDGGIAMLTTAQSLEGSNIFIYDTESGERRYPVIRDFYSTMAANSTGTFLAAGTSDGTVWFLDALTGETLSFWQSTVCIVTGIALGPDNTEIAATGLRPGNCQAYYQLQIGLIDPDTLNVTHLQDYPSFAGMTHEQVTAHHWAVAYSPDGETIVTGLEGNFFLWDRDSGVMHAIPIPIEIHTPSYMDASARIDEIAFSPSGDFVALSGFVQETYGMGDSILRKLSIYIYDTSTGSISEIDAHDSPTTGIAISPDSRLIASSSTDIGVRLWDSETLELVHEISLPGGANDVAFNADGTEVVIGGNDGRVTIWQVK